MNLMHSDLVEISILASAAQMVCSRYSEEVIGSLVGSQIIWKTCSTIKGADGMEIPVKGVDANTDDRLDCSIEHGGMIYK